jgi:hypothetical protein
MMSKPGWLESYRSNGAASVSANITSARAILVCFPELAVCPISRAVACYIRSIPDGVRCEGEHKC